MPGAAGSTFQSVKERFWRGQSRWDYLWLRLKETTPPCKAKALLRWRAEGNDSGKGGLGGEVNGENRQGVILAETISVGASWGGLLLRRAACPNPWPGCKIHAGPLQEQHEGCSSPLWLHFWYIHDHRDVCLGITPTWHCRGSDFGWPFPLSTPIHVTMPRDWAVRHAGGQFAWLIKEEKCPSEQTTTLNVVWRHRCMPTYVLMWASTTGAAASIKTWKKEELYLCRYGAEIIFVCKCVFSKSMLTYQLLQEILRIHSRRAF